MKNFTYYRPGTAEQAVALLEANWGKTELLAGGTDLLDLQKEYVAQPTRVVSVSGIKGLAAIEVDNQNPARWIKIGAGTTLAAIAAASANSPAPGSAGDGGGRHWRPADPQHGHVGRQFCAAATAAGISATSTSTVYSRAATAALPWRARTATTRSSRRAIRA